MLGLNIVNATHPDNTSSNDSRLSCKIRLEPSS